MIRTSRLLGLFTLSLLTLMLTACGGGSSSGGSNNNNGESPLPAGSGRLVVTNPASSTPISIRNIAYSTAPSVAAQRQSGSTNTNGEYKFDDAEQVTFTLFNQDIGPLDTKSTINEDDLATSLCKGSSKPVFCQYATARNLQHLLLSADNDQDTSTGITIMAAFQKDPPLALDSSVDEFETALTKKLAKLGRQPVSTFSPSLGINLEAPQPEADEVGGQPVPFVDLFRISRPFPEFSCTSIQYDSNGWPSSIPAECDTEENATFHTPTWATTLMLRYVPAGAIPTGKYTVLYEGSGNLQYSGIGNKLTGESNQGRDIINISAELIQSRGTAGLRLQLKDIDPANPVKNIRIVMPGGTCEGNPFIRVESDADCPAGQYRSFVDQLEANRNAIVFNPDYLRFLKDFKVIRTMNFMEASPRNPCYNLTDDAYTTCLLQEFTWSDRARMNQASWGGSSRTSLLKRYGRGVPLEVVIALVNTLNRDPWFNIPHNATDDYVERFATYVRDNLNQSQGTY